MIELNNSSFCYKLYVAAEVAYGGPPFEMKKTLMMNQD